MPWINSTVIHLYFGSGWKNMSPVFLRHLNCALFRTSCLILTQLQESLHPVSLLPDLESHGLLWFVSKTNY